MVRGSSKIAHRASTAALEGLLGKLRMKKKKTPQRMRIQEAYFPMADAKDRKSNWKIKEEAHKEFRRKK